MRKYKNTFLLLLIFLSNEIVSQQIKNINFVKAEVNISIIPDSSVVQGSVSYTFNVLNPVKEINIDAKNSKFYNVKINGKTEEFKNDNTKLRVAKSINPSQQNKLTFNFKTKVKKAMYFLKRKGNWNIWTQGQGKYTSNWLPSIDDVNDKIEFDLNITFNNTYKVLSNGKLIDKTVNSTTTTWHYDMQKPMSSYLLAIAIGKYDYDSEQSKSGVPLKYYYYSEDSLKREPTYRHTKQIFDFFEKEIKVPFPWQNYKQVPVNDFLYAGMENTSLTIFSDSYFIDNKGFNDQNYVNVNAHELAHQWFGNYVTATSGTHHWLQEGFATYYALLAEKEIFGKNYFYFKLFESLNLLKQQDINEKGTSLLNPSSSSLTFYQRGAWVLYALREKVGDTVFKTAVKNYLIKHQFQSVKTSDFILELEKQYGKSLNEFVDLWIKNKIFPSIQALELLKSKSSFINEYLMVDCEAANSKCHEYLKYYVSDEAKSKVISQNPKLITQDAFKSSLKVRQSIAIHLKDIPLILKADYESLLNDESYITIENALYNLWINFPDDAKKYLDKTKSIYGLNNANIRILWLFLALHTPNYNESKRSFYFDELTSYTNPEYNFELRINAFNHLKSMEACEEKCKQNIKQARYHHNWRMVKYAKAYLSELKNSN